MEDAYIDILISKYLAGEAGPEEAMELEDWKERSADNLAYYTECEKLFFASQNYKTIGQPEIKAALDSVKSKLEYTETRTPVFRLNNYFKIAAAITLLIGTVVVFNYYRKSGGEELTTYTSSGGEKKIELSDNSSVILSPNSEMTIDEGFGKTNRLVKLIGSAYFTVTHSEEQPLIVDAGHVYIKDIGTKFKITTSYTKDTVSIAVDEGIVLLYDSAGSEITLIAGQQAAYIKSLKKITGYPEASETATFVFTDQPLKEIVIKLGTAFGTPITLENKEIENCRLTTRFSGEKLETMLEVITETLGLTLTKTNDVYSIKGERCNN